jgi:hypothetical protein
LSKEWSLIIYPPSAQAKAIAASNPTISAGGAGGAGGRGPGGDGVHARQPRIHAAMPLVANSAAPSPARLAPSRNATRRKDS